MSDDRQNQPKSGSGSARPFKKTGFGGNKVESNAGERRYGRPAGGNGGDKRPFRSENRPAGGNFGEKKPYSRPVSGDKVEGNGEKHPFRGENRPAGGKFGERKPFGRPAGGDRRPQYGRPVPRGGDRRPEKARPEQQEGLASRRLALEVIREVTEKGAYINQVLNEKLQGSGLSALDRRLAAKLAYDVIEHQMTLDYALNQLMARPDTDIKLRNVLRLGACQILLEDRIPESAACNTAVVLCKEIGLEGLAGVCNGILRNLIRQKDEIAWPDPETEPVKALSVKHSVPEWLVERLQADWGDQAEAIMAFHEEETTITVRPNLLKHSDEAFEALLDKKVWEHAKTDVPHAWRIAHMADIGRDASFVGGDFSIQSESSMMACYALSPRLGATVLDCCAAPGGKSCLIAEMMQGTGRVQAWELHEHRTGLIAAQAKRLGIDNIRPMTRDASKHRMECVEAMDYVLLDAPCTGLGVMAGKPDVKYRVTPESVAELTALQEKILDTVCTYVKKGGTLVYSTCSVLKDENERQAAAFLERHPEFELVTLPDTIPEKYRQHAGLGLQLLPHRDHVEGFYICKMRRKRV